MSLGDIVIYGAGSIGSTIGGWLTPKYRNVYLMARGEHAKIMRERGLTLLETNKASETVIVKLINSLSEGSDTRVVILAVKNYDLEEAAQDIFSRLGNKCGTCVVEQHGARRAHEAQKGNRTRVS